MKFIRNWLLTLSLLINFSLLSCSNKEPSRYLKIVSCHDGDTINDINNNHYRVLGIDTPEISHSWDNFKNSDGLEYYFALKAKEFCTLELANKKVKIISNQKESYGRFIARIFINGYDYATQLLKKGLARVAYISFSKGSKYYYNDINYINGLKEVEKHAKENHIGLWNYTNVKLIFPKV